VVLVALPFAAAQRPSGASLAWGAAAGASGTLGGIALYLGFRYAAFSVAAPISAGSRCSRGCSGASGRAPWP
jgi:hypothetical protein